MDTFEKTLIRRTEQSVAAVKDAIVWFYAVFLFEPAENNRLIVTDLVQPKHYAMLQNAGGPKEKAALVRDAVVKLDYLSAKLEDITDGYANALRIADGNVPGNIRSALGKEIDQFHRRVKASLYRTMQDCFNRRSTAYETANRVSETYAAELVRLNLQAKACYSKAAWYRIAEICADGREDIGFRWKLTPSEGTCELCAARKDRVFSLSELQNIDALPPGHPNCRCELIPTVIGTSETELWYDPLLRIPSDAGKLIHLFRAAQLERFTKAIRENDVRAGLDWLTLGTIEGLFGSLSANASAMLAEPSFYTIGNWATMGFFDLARDTFQPDEPLSLEHWLNSLALASIIAANYQAYRKSLEQTFKVYKTRVQDSNLIDKVLERGYKISREKVISIMQLEDGRIIWLEEGGLKHILERHASQFTDINIATSDIPSVIMQALQVGDYVNMQGTREIYRIFYKGKERYIAISVSNNGYIVGANPRVKNNKILKP
ncbi:MAG: hypothetical protein VB111_09570 [Clostridiaceae bacterium]|nr:hypothetical protein [Clostridiaceae bacterium]